MGKQKQNTVFAVGKSVIDRGSRTDIGELMYSFKGGGHVAAGTCQVSNEEAEGVLEELIDIIMKHLCLPCNASPLRGRKLKIN